MKIESFPQTISFATKEDYHKEEIIIFVEVHIVNKSQKMRFDKPQAYGICTLRTFDTVVNTYNILHYKR